jgi:NADH-quinone oxidoreductase subunit M
MIPFLLLQTIVVPMVASLAMLFLPAGKTRQPAVIAVAALTYTTFLLGMAGVRIYAGDTIVERYPIGPLAGFNLLADGLSLPIAFFVNLICLALAIFSIKYVEHRIELIYAGADDRTSGLYFRRFFLLYLFFPTGFMGVAFATNLLWLYFSLELLTIIPLYFLMAQFGYSDYITRYKVALMCLYWGVAGATLFLIGIIWGYLQVGSFEIRHWPALSGNPLTIWIALVIWIGLATKLAIIPLHVWMPWVHAEHPTCIAGLLAIYANIAVYVGVRVVILPLRQDLVVLSMPLMIFALATMVYGALLTLAQSDAKRFCACSTISQISYSVVGIASLTALGVQGGIFYFLSHILGKTVLFSTAGILVYQTETRDLKRMRGLGSKMPLTAFLWIAASLILSALPPTSGFVGKWLLFAGAFKAFPDNPLGLLVTIAAILSTLLTLVYTFMIGIRIFFSRPGPDPEAHPASDPPLTMSLPLVVLVVAAFALGLYPAPVIHLMDSAIGAF